MTEYVFPIGGGLQQGMRGANSWFITVFSYNMVRVCVFDEDF